MSLGHHLPPELFEKVLEELADSYTFQNRPKELYRIWGICALTCRYWAMQLRYRLLADAHLRNVNDLRRMCMICNLPPGFRLPNPLVYLRRLYLICEDSNPFWLHIVFGAIEAGQALRRNILVTVRLNNYCSANSSMAPRSLFYYLPVVSPSLYRQMWQLVLTRMHFRRASDMFHLVSQMPNLQCLRIADITWDPSSPRHPLPRVPAFLANIVVYETDKAGHGGRGILPWVLAAVVDFPPYRYMAGCCDNLPLVLDPYKDTASPSPPTDRAQSEHIMDILSVFSHDKSAYTLDPSGTNVWDLERSLCSKYDLTRSTGEYAFRSVRPGLDCSPAALYVRGVQEGPNDALTETVTPQFTFTFKPVRFGEAGSVNELLYVTDIMLDFHCLRLNPVHLLHSTLR